MFTPKVQAERIGWSLWRVVRCARCWSFKNATDRRRAALRRWPGYAGRKAMSCARCGERRSYQLKTRPRTFECARCGQRRSKNRPGGGTKVCRLGWVRSLSPKSTGGPPLRGAGCLSWGKGRGACGRTSIEAYSVKRRLFGYVTLPSIFLCSIKRAAIPSSRPAFSHAIARSSCQVWPKAAA